MSSPGRKNTPPSKKCRLAEIVQYKCDPEQRTSAAPPQWHCLPVIRIFRICQGRPAVEITKFIDMNVETGAVQVPSQSRLRPGEMSYDTTIRSPMITSQAHYAQGSQLGSQVGYRSRTWNPRCLGRVPYRSHTSQGRGITS
ncbi:hypothetical protein C8Q77DRAFT_696980 [Trametes polyzona]|nr:hypothetical protein C8Q77DRAFT_696980 [Trametes polyzona]